MNSLHMWGGRFKQFFLDNKFVLFLLVLLLIGLNILVFTKASFIFHSFYRSCGNDRIARCSDGSRLLSLKSDR